MNQPPIHTGPQTLTEFGKQCEDSLLAGVQYEFTYPDGCSFDYWPVQDIKNLNHEFLSSLQGKANVYALFVRQNLTVEWIPVYVGQRKSANLRERLTQHLIRKSAQTGSMLEAVKAAVSAGQRVGISFIKVEPESLRLFIEEAIIIAREDGLPWNTHR